MKAGRGVGSILFLVGMMFLIPSAGATLIGFDGITNNKAADVATGESQLSLEVTDHGNQQVLFTFFNIGTKACSITDVYFDNDQPPITLASFAGLIDKDENGGNNGVDFSQYASPTNIPGADNVSPAFVTTLGFSADSDSPIQSNGVNPGETLGVIFNLISGETFNSVLAALISGDLRVGIHVQGFKYGGSEAFINTRPNGSLIPEPGTVGLLTAGLISLATLRKRRVA